MDFDTIMQYVGYGLIGVLVLFIVLGMLFGLGRGLKRSAIRLLIVAIFVLIAFFLTPSVCWIIYSSNIPIAGNTPSGWVSELITSMQQSPGVQNLTPFIPYIQEYVIGLVFAIINLIVFLVLYLILKPISWIIYAIIAHFAAPKKDKEGHKYKRYRFFGMLVGMVQGVFLFFFFMLPVNGILSVATNFAHYQTLGGEYAEVASTSDQTNSDFDLQGYAKSIEKGVAPYQNILKYTGMGFLTDAAFEYEVTVTVQDTYKIRLNHDLRVGLELAADIMEFNDKALPKVREVTEATGDFMLGMAELNHQDYDALHYMVNKAFDLDILTLGDMVLGDLDKILATSVSGSTEVYPGANAWGGNVIYQDSMYASWLDDWAVPTHRGEFIQGMRAMVQYISDEKMAIFRDDVNTCLNLTENLFATKINYPDAAHQQPIAVALSRQGLGVGEYLDIMLTPVNETDNVLDLLFDNTLDLKIFRILEQKHANKFLANSTFFDVIDPDAETSDLRTFVRDFASSFMGENAVGTREQPGNWRKFAKLSTKSLRLVRDNLGFMDVLSSEDVPSALLQYLSDMIDETPGVANKYHKIDDMAETLHDLIFEFDTVTNFARSQIAKMESGEIKQIFETLLNTDDVDTWKESFHSLANIAKLLTNDNIINDILSINTSDPEAGKQIIDKIVEELTPDEVTDVLFEVLKIEDLNDTINQVLDEYDFGGYENEDAPEELKEAIQDLRDYLDDYQNSTKTDAELKAELGDIVAELWTQLGNAA